MRSENSNHTIDLWIQAVEQNNFDRICAKPSPTSWSLGQVCMHLITETSYYLKQIHICLSTDDNADKEMTAHAKSMFRNNEFPDELIEGPPSNDNTPQPRSKEELLKALLKLKDELNKVAAVVSTHSGIGKTKHPGLNYFTAREWLQFADMHMRHHLRQKKRIEEFLTGQPN
ncbi:MAG: DinB family protein [Bacteroidota bacterium]